MVPPAEARVVQVLTAAAASSEVALPPLLWNSARAQLALFCYASSRIILAKPCHNASTVQLALCTAKAAPLLIVCAIFVQPLESTAVQPDDGPDPDDTGGEKKKKKKKRNKVGRASLATHTEPSPFSLLSDYLLSPESRL